VFTPKILKAAMRASDEELALWPVPDLQKAKASVLGMMDLRPKGGRWIWSKEPNYTPDQNDALALADRLVTAMEQAAASGRI
jgi:hypothetical protein